MVKCSLANAAPSAVTATSRPLTATMALGQFRGTAWRQKVLCRCRSTPSSFVRSKPPESLVKLTIDQQTELIRTFLPPELWPHAEKPSQTLSTAMDAVAAGSPEGPLNPQTGAAQRGHQRKHRRQPAAPGPNGTPAAATTKVPVPAEETGGAWAQRPNVRRLSLQKLGPKFRRWARMSSANSLPVPW